MITYVGTRENNQILATNATGSNARSSQISREFYGSDLRWDNRGEVAGKQYNISLGLNYGKSTDARKDTNIQGTGLGPNRIEDNIVDNFDQYIQGKLALTDNFDVHAGVRHTKVTLKVNDQLTPPDNSGSVDYQKTNPVLGATWKVTPALNLYANFGKGFETPTFIEAAYNSTAASATPNLTLKPSQSNNYEVGAKAYITDSSLLTLTAFRINTQDELVVSANSNGRSVYANANNTKRYGTEISLDTRYENNITTYLSYSFLNAKYSSSYVGNNGLIESGNYIPGTYRNQLYGEVAWKYQPLGFYTALEGRYNSKVYVDDINSQSASSYTIFNLRAGLEQNLSHWNFKEYIRLENMFDREYIGAVRVNDTNARFYEPAAGRNYLVGINAQYKF